MGDHLIWMYPIQMQAVQISRYTRQDQARMFLRYTWLITTTGSSNRQQSIRNFSHHLDSSSDHLFVTLRSVFPSTQQPQQYPKQTLRIAERISIWKLMSFREDGTTQQEFPIFIRMTRSSAGLGLQRNMKRGVRMVRAWRKNMAIIMLLPFSVQWLIWCRNYTSNLEKMSLKRIRAERWMMIPMRTWFTEAIPKYSPARGIRTVRARGMTSNNPPFPAPAAQTMIDSNSNMGVMVGPKGFPQSKWQLSLRFFTTELVQKGLGSEQSIFSTTDTQTHPRKYMSRLRIQFLSLQTMLETTKISPTSLGSARSMRKLKKRSRVGVWRC